MDRFYVDRAYASATRYWPAPDEGSCGLGVSPQGPSLAVDGRQQ